MILNDLERTLFLSTLDQAIKHLGSLKLLAAGAVAVADAGTPAALNAIVVHDNVCAVFEWLERERARLAPREAVTQSELPADAVPTASIH